MKNFLLLLLPFLACCQANGNASDKHSSTVNANKATGFTISGTIQGLADGEVKLTNREGAAIATTQSKGGAFTLSGSVAEPSLHGLVFGAAQPVYFFLENAPVKITGTSQNLKAVKIEGSASQKDFAAFEQTFNPIFSNLSAVAAEINAATSDAKKAQLMPKYNMGIATLQTEVDAFIKPRSNSYVSLFLLGQTIQATENIGDVDRRFNSLSEPVRSSATGQQIAAYISQAKAGAIGADAADFTQNDVNDKPVALSSFRGKYVLIDFWASWCRPCRMENPNVVKAYNRFKNKNFTVLGVSLDQNKDAWVKAIEKDNLTWTQVSDLQFWSNAAAQLYKVQSIPQNFLIDPNGKIVAKDLRGEDLEKKLCEYLGCSN